uniref:Uncharacterized protein n=1 Tax=Anguilla anguilla TaxID=7936 RepID=A0A0E9PTZ7_ANGAN
MMVLLLQFSSVENIAPFRPLFSFVLHSQNI